MASEFPKLEKHLDELLWKFEQELQDLITKHGLEDVEIFIGEENFFPRSPRSKSVYFLREVLDECINSVTGKVDITKVDEEHISAATGLIRLGKYQKTAIDVLTQILGYSTKTLTPEQKIHLREMRKLASEALSDCSAEIAKFNNASINTPNNLHSCTAPYPKNGQTCVMCPDGERCY